MSGMNCKLQRLVRAFISTIPATLLTVAMGVKAEQSQNWFMWAVAACMSAITVWLGWWLVHERPNVAVRRDAIAASPSTPLLADPVVETEACGKPSPSCCGCVALNSPDCPRM